MTSHGSFELHGASCQAVSKKRTSHQVLSNLLRVSGDDIDTIAKYFNSKEWLKHKPYNVSEKKWKSKKYRENYGKKYGREYLKKYENILDACSKSTNEQIQAASLGALKKFRGQVSKSEEKAKGARSSR